LINRNQSGFFPDPMSFQNVLDPKRFGNSWDQGKSRSGCG